MVATITPIDFFFGLAVKISTGVEAGRVMGLAFGWVMVAGVVVAGLAAVETDGCSSARSVAIALSEWYRWAGALAKQRLMTDPISAGQVGT